MLTEHKNCHGPVRSEISRPSCHRCCPFHVECHLLSMLNTKLRNGVAIVVAGVRSSKTVLDRMYRNHMMPPSIAHSYPPVRECRDHERWDDGGESAIDLAAKMQSFTIHIGRGSMRLITWVRYSQVCLKRCTKLTEILMFGGRKTTATALQHSQLRQQRLAAEKLHENEISSIPAFSALADETNQRPPAVLFTSKYLATIGQDSVPH